MDYKEILYYVFLILSIVVSFVVTIISIYRDKKNKKSKANTTNAEEDNSNDFVIFKEKIVDNIPKYMIAAETLYNSIVNPSIKKTGAQKLSYVLDKVKIDCLTNNVKYDEQAIRKEVENLVQLTKQVNSKQN